MSPFVLTKKETMFDGIVQVRARGGLGPKQFSVGELMGPRQFSVGELSRDSRDGYGDIAL